MHNPELVLENEKHKFLCNFDIQTNHLISARRPDLIITNKNKITYKIVNFAVPADHRVKLKESRNKDKFLEPVPCLGIEKIVEHEGDSCTNCNWCSWYSHQRIGKMTKKTSGDNPNYSIGEIGQNTKKSPGDLRRLVVTQTPVKDHKLTLM